VAGRPSPLAGRTVLVTGASSGIGEATAIAVAQRGATVLLVARRAEELARVQQLIEAAGGSAASYVCDLTDGEAVDALVEDVLLEHGAVDYLVNDAGRSIRRSLELSYERFHDVERSMAINFFGPVRLTMGLPPRPTAWPGPSPAGAGRRHGGARARGPAADRQHAGGLRLRGAQPAAATQHGRALRDGRPGVPGLGRREGKGAGLISEAA